MEDADSAQTRSRRRGAALQNALLDAAWDELAERGYSAFTIEAVAARAQTSRAVIYRRWPAKPDLVRAAVVHSGLKEVVAIPDTGSLRNDVVQLLHSANRAHARLAVAVAVQLAGYYAETGTSMSDLRSVFLSGRTDAMNAIAARAVARGEVDPGRLTPRVVSVPFDLFRGELVMTLKPVPEDVIESIVDDVFMPLLAR